MNKGDIAELRRLLGEATQGKWKTWGGEVRADVDGTSSLETSVLVCDPEPSAERPRRVHNARLIAAMQRALPELLDIAERGVDWGRMTAREVWDALVSAPRVASPWEPGELGQMDVRRALDGTIVATTLWVTPRYPTAPWRVAVSTADRSGADAVLREHGWLLPEGV